MGSFQLDWVLVEHVVVEHVGSFQLDWVLVEHVVVDWPRLMVDLILSLGIVLFVVQPYPYTQLL